MYAVLITNKRETFPLWYVARFYIIKPFASVQSKSGVFDCHETFQKNLMYYSVRVKLTHRLV